MYVPEELNVCDNTYDAFGVTEDDAEDASDVPTALVVVIVNVYAVSVANDPVTVIVPSTSVFVYVSAIDGDDVIPTDVIGAPLLAPAVHTIVTEVELATDTEFIVGAFGLPAP